MGDTLHLTDSDNNSDNPQELYGFGHVCVYKYRFVEPQ